MYRTALRVGQGNFGTAKLMRAKASGQLLAIKYIERGKAWHQNAHLHYSSSTTRRGGSRLEVLYLVL